MRLFGPHGQSGIKNQGFSRMLNMRDTVFYDRLRHHVWPLTAKQFRKLMKLMTAVREIKKHDGIQIPSTRIGL